MTGRYSVARLALVASLGLLASGCVKKSTHRVVLSNLDQSRGEVATLDDQVARLEARTSDLLDEIEVEQQRRDSVESSLHVAMARSEAESAGRLSEARREIERLGALLRQQGSNYDVLNQRLEALAAVEREVRERNAIYEDIVRRFQSLTDGGQLTVAIERGRLVIVLPQDVLFESGSARLGQEGQTVIAEVAGVLASFPDRRFQVEGHTDNVPIATDRFPSNWELSSARALAVVRLLTQRGVLPDNVSGAAYGEYQPVAPNDERDSRRRNRRIEVVMLPNLDVVAGTELPGAR